MLKVKRRGASRVHCNLPYPLWSYERSLKLFPERFPHAAYFFFQKIVNLFKPLNILVKTPHFICFWWIPKCTTDTSYQLGSRLYQAKIHTNNLNSVVIRVKVVSSKNSHQRFEFYSYKLGSRLYQVKIHTNDFNSVVIN